jgi:hypothetical protein
MDANGKSSRGRTDTLVTNPDAVAKPVASPGN